MVQLTGVFQINGKMNKHRIIFLLFQLSLITSVFCNSNGGDGTGGEETPPIIYTAAATTEAPTPIEAPTQTPVNAETTAPTPLIVSSVLIEPFLIYKDGAYEGYIKDLLDHIVTALNRTYQFSIQTEYGRRNKTGQWIGLIGDVLSDEADIAAAPLIKNKIRASVVAFCDPFLTRELSFIQHCKHSKQIQSLEDLVNQETVSYGITADSLSFKKMNSSEDQVLVDATQYLSNTIGALMENNNAGFSRCLKEDNFAYLMDNITADWIINQPNACKLDMINTRYQRKEYAFAVANGSSLHEEINRELKNMGDKKDELYRKWWKENVCNRDEERPDCANIGMTVVPRSTNPTNKGIVSSTPSVPRSSDNSSPSFSAATIMLLLLIVSVLIW